MQISIHYRSMCEKYRAPSNIFEFGVYKLHDTHEVQQV